MAITTKSMGVAHKEALATGRTEGRTVRAYLEALETFAPKRGRRRTKETITVRIERITDDLEDVNSLQRLQLTQQRLDLTAELDNMNGTAPDITEIEAEFVQVARSYAKRKGISYAAFRTAGVPAAVLRQAKIPRTQ